jgi:phospholipid-binding lipoprotein MlaA
LLAGGGAEEMAKIFIVALIGVLVGGLATPAAMAQTEELMEDTMPESYADPFESFNQKMFWFNLRLDEYVLRPVATAYDRVLPDAAQRGIGRFFHNLGIVERLANNLFQTKFRGAGQELGRFAINTTLGGVGFVDAADRWFDLKESNEDFGQTLGTYGVGQGPYLVLPFFGPSTVRDAFGLAVDSAINPMNYLLPRTQVIAIRSGLTVASAVNYRSLNLELFEDVDRFAVDLYGAAQDAYLQRRGREVEE